MEREREWWKVGGRERENRERGGRGRRGKKGEYTHTNNFITRVLVEHKLPC